MISSTSYQVILKYMPDELRRIMKLADMSVIENLTEVRLYNGRGIAFVSPQKNAFLNMDGRISGSFGSSAVKVNGIHIKSIIALLCHNSVYSHEKELSDGCFVLESGIRVGISGSYCNGSGQTLQEFSSLNFRIPRQNIGCGQTVFNKLYGQNIVLCGNVNSGKTTLLRDICRLYGNVQKCTLIDERNEISAMKNGMPTNDIGLLTDVISGKNRHESIISAVRTLSPQYIFCDEIADEMDAKAILCGTGSGVRFVASIHASNYDELMKRNVMKLLAAENVFDSAVFLHGAENPASVREIRSLRNGG